VRLSRAVVPLLLALPLSACADAGDSAAPTGPSAPSKVSGSPTRSQEWRTEVYHDVQLRVPRTWGLGYAPVVDGTTGGDPMTCGVGPAQGSSGPYVGRPGYGSDLCQVVSVDDLDVGGEAVWFDSLLPVGTSEEGDLHVRTVDVGSERVTVATFDDGLGEKIVASVEQTDLDDNGCPSAYAPEHRYPDEGFGDALSLSVCVYDAWPDDELQRTWSQRLGARQAKDLLTALETARPATCEAPAEDREQVVLLRVRTEDPFGDALLVRDLTYTGDGCPHLTDVTGGGDAVRPVASLVEPWAVDGVRAYVSGGAVPMRLNDYFRPMMG
jgi:hypothetical protein